MASLRILVALSIFTCLHGTSIDIANQKHDDDDKLSFFFYGDWGHNVIAKDSESGIDFEGSLVAAQVIKTAAIVKPKFFVMLGDNFYDNGVRSTTDPLWNSVYSSLYNAPDTQVPWYPILGNHDYYNPNGDKTVDIHTPLAQLAYTQEYRDKRWQFPNNYYKTHHAIPGSKKTVDIFHIDTVLMAPNHKDPLLTGLPLANPDGTTSDVQKILNSAQLAWLTDALEDSKSHYKIVAGHYHVYTVTDGDDVVPEMETYLVPLMKKYKVNAYINAHEHNLEHMYFEGIHYITAGHGCDKDDAIAAKPWTAKGALTGTEVVAPAEGVYYAHTVGSFGVMEATDDSLSFYFVDENGNKVYSAVIAASHGKNLRGA